MSGENVGQLMSLRDLVAEFLGEKADGSATAAEISQALFLAWSPDDIWHLAQSNPQLFVVGRGDHELPPEMRVVRLAELDSAH
jgi:hypothetical protein